MKNTIRWINKYKYPYLFIMPAVSLLLVFTIIPIFVALIISLTNIDLSGLADWSNIKFIGLRNYINLFKDSAFKKSIFNTVYYVVIGVPLVIIFSMFIAILLDYGKNIIFKILRLFYYMPSITNSIAVAIVWGWLYNTNYGLFNYLLSLVGLPGQQWLSSPILAKLSLILLALWKAMGANMIIFLAALQGIPKVYYEAADIDGANKWQKLIKIKIPLLSHATFFVAVTTTIGWLQFFEEPFVMTGGGPLNSTLSMALYIYQNGFQLGYFRYSAAGSFVLFLMIITVTLMQFKFKKNNVEY
ncbi:sugar ABC transporter permease [Thermoanaerobacter sp. YS13]|uniref:carbohydrate ABC transporter permease n=1 Tax=Thermoanaerobacter sp. YS13 TaxID=1511746 RepID=UPI000575789D|nr:sugar ABC transporter permease [Thermoanaerobacter sp. YS13]KHO63087.1 sugar ABC transporter permease [Thermoanaerobacter sp. YS13]